MRHDLPAHLWHKSSYSNGGSGNCLETQLTADGLVAVGDSKDRTRGAFAFSPTEWAAFVDLIKQGD
ncbi:DUF397 domain-containing protein [Streptomyces sp. P38-E01]|uniref:DUF397 domain-containing protein n=1 Tax=Streptomyces tardus TaxID=2780544 RepID=A0A949JEG7_9ACTN|nr:DUF397 domain-containing protein [Streptomyces tardus]MBU7598562.1 DUF397 domain-containing protein [Streptomyces tardus]